MKRCPTCNRTFVDDAQTFCLDDGSTLLQENATSFDPQATLAMVGSQPTTPPSNPYGSGAGGPGSGAGQGSYGSQGGQGSYGSQGGQGAYGSGAGQNQQGSAWSPTPPAYTPSSTPPAKRNMLPWILGGVAVVVIGLIGLVVVIAIALSSSNSNSNNSNVSSNSNNSNNSNKSNSNRATRTDTVINSTDGKIQVSVPSTWKSTTELNDNAELQVSDTGNQMYLIVLTDSKSKYASMDLDKHSGETLDTLTRSMTYASKIGPTRLTIDGHSAVQYEVRGEIKNLNVIYIHTTVETPNNYQQIVAWTLQSEYPKRESTIKDIINSFKEN